MKEFYDFSNVLRNFVFPTTYKGVTDQQFQKDKCMVRLKSIQSILDP